MRRFFPQAAVLALLLAFVPSCPAADKPALKPVRRGGYQTEKAPVATTEDPLDDTVKKLRQMQGSDNMPPEVREQLKNTIEQAEAFQNDARSAEYGRPAGRGANPGGASGPREARRPGAVAVSEEAQRVPVLDLSGAAAPSGRGAAAAGQPVVLPPSGDSDPQRPAPIGGLNFDGKVLLQDKMRRPPGGGLAAAGQRLAGGDFRGAAEAAGQAAEESPGSADAFMVRAMAREALGDRKGAMADAYRAAQLDPAKHAARLAAAEAGGRLFDPESPESRGFLDKLLAPPAPKRRFPWLGLLLLVCLVAAGGSAWGLSMFWADVPPELRARLLAVVPLRPRPRGGPSLSGATPMPHRSASPLRPGVRLGSKYELVRPLGRDGTVEVWKARDTLLDRDVMLKRLYVGRDSAELDLRRAEARQAAALHHPNVAELYEIAEIPEGLFAVYEYASGKSLAEVLVEKRTLSLKQARDVLVPVCRALEHAHRRGVVHGGLSPRRVVLTRQGYVKVMDFVLARTMASGSSEYAAPETKRGAPTPASDVYSAGMVFFEMLAGHRPGEGDWEASGQVAEILEKALDLDVRTRTGSARELLEALRALPADTLPPRQLTPRPQAAEEPLTAEPDEESRQAAEDAVGPAGPDEPLIDPGPPTHPTNPG